MQGKQRSLRLLRDHDFEEPTAGIESLASRRKSDHATLNLPVTEMDGWVKQFGMKHRRNGFRKRVNAPEAC